MNFESGQVQHPPLEVTAPGTPRQCSIPTLLNPNSVILSAAEGASSCPGSALALATPVGSPCASYGLLTQNFRLCRKAAAPSTTWLGSKTSSSPCGMPRVTGYLFQSPLALNIHGCLDDTVEG